MTGLFTPARRVDLIALVCLGFLGLVTLLPALGADFALIDDHEILSYSPYVTQTPELRAGSDLLGRLFVDDPALGRVRPLYWVIRFGEVALLGQNAAAWHALYVLLGIASAGLMYATLRTARVGWVPSALAAGWVLVTPGVSSVWIRLGPQESLGTVCLLVASLAAARGARPGSRAVWDVVFAVALGLAPFVKESFILAVPAGLGLRLFFLSQRAGRVPLMTRRTLLASVPPLLSGTGMLLVAATTALRSGAGSYGGRVLALSSVLPAEQDLKNLAILAFVGGALVPVLVWCAAHAGLRRGWTAPAFVEWCGGAGLVLLLVLPQLALYHANGFGAGDGRYILPAGLGLAAGVAAGMHWLGHNGYRRALAVLVTGWVMVLGFGSLSTWRAAEAQRVDTVGLGQIVDNLARSAPTGAEIAIVAEPLQSELAVSLPYHLAARGRPDLSTRLVLADATQGDPTVTQQLARGLVDQYFVGRVEPNTADCGDFSAVVLFTAPANAEARLACLADPALQARTFSPAAT